MDFSYSEDQEALRALARQILEGEATHERLKQVEDGEERVDRGLWKALADANLLGVAVPEAHGGSGLGLVELCLLLEEAGRVVAPVPLVETLVLGALPLAAFGSEAQRTAWLPQVASGEAMLTAAVAEVAGAEVSAVHDGTGWRLSGTCALVPSAHLAQRVLVPARTSEEALGIFLVDPGAEGAALERHELVHRYVASTLSLRSVRVPDGDVLGDPGGGAGILAWLRERAVLALCAMQLGVASRALDMTAAYTRERRQFDRPIGSFQAVHTRAGDAYVDLQAMKLTFWRALHVLEQGDEAEEALAVAKYWAAESGTRITYAAQHLHGGIGVDTDYPLHRYYLWATWAAMHLGSGSEKLALLGRRLAAA